MLNAHVLAERVRAGEAFIALGSRTRERLLSRMASKMTEQRETRCLRFALADASGPFAHVLALVDADVFVMQVVDERLEAVKGFAAVVPLAGDLGIGAGCRFADRVVGGELVTFW